MRHERRKALREADCVLLAGVPCDFRLDYGRHVRRSATLIAANRSRGRAPEPPADDRGDRRRRPLLVELAARVGDGAHRARVDRDAGARDAEREREIDAQAQAGRRARESGRVLPRAGSAAGDARSSSPTAAISSPPRRTSCARAGRCRGSIPGVFGTLGVGAGFALGAALARPDSEVWLVWGDGACGYGLAEFDTFVRHGIPVIAVVGNDAGWTQIAREQVKMLGDDVGTVLARTAYHEVARGFGAEGIEVSSDAEVDAALAQAQRDRRVGPAGAGQRLARPHRIPRRLDFDVGRPPRRRPRVTR